MGLDGVTVAAIRRSALFEWIRACGRRALCALGDVARIGLRGSDSAHRQHRGRNRAPFVQQLICIFDRRRKGHAVKRTCAVLISSHRPQPVRLRASHISQTLDHSRNAHYHPPDRSNVARSTGRTKALIAFCVPASYLKYITQEARHELDHKLRPSNDKFAVFTPRSTGQPLDKMLGLRNHAVPPRIGG